MIVLGHGVDGQVAADQVFFQGDFGACKEGETAVTTPALALGAGQGVFLAGLRVQKYRKVCAHWAIAQLKHLFGAGADDDPVDLADFTTQQAITYCAADFVNLHHGSSAKCGG